MVLPPSNFLVCNKTPKVSTLKGILQAYKEAGFTGVRIEHSAFDTWGVQAFMLLGKTPGKYVEAVPLGPNANVFQSAPVWMVAHELQLAYFAYPDRFQNYARIKPPSDAPPRAK